MNIAVGVVLAIVLLAVWLLARVARGRRTTTNVVHDALN